jgi:hypothetical protein
MKAPIPFFSTSAYRWGDQMDTKAYVCGYCDRDVGSEKGFAPKHRNNNTPLPGFLIYTCPRCGGPSYFTSVGDQVPAPALGKPVDNVPPDLKALYDEARRTTTAGCYTAAVMLCRKMLMNFAVHHNAIEGESFAYYVDYLSKNNYIPPDGKHWVDHIRNKGNEANHEIKLMGEADASDLLVFVEMLLRLNFELPGMIQKPKTT